MHFSSIRAALDRSCSLQPFQPFVAHFAWRAALPHFFAPQGGSDRVIRSPRPALRACLSRLQLAGCASSTLCLFRQKIIKRESRAFGFQIDAASAADHD
jgi:hypothetical protein